MPAPRPTGTPKVVVIGVSGCGRSTVAAALAVEPDVPEPRLRARMAARRDHHMPVALPTSRLATLEPLGADERGTRLTGDGDAVTVLRAAREAPADLVHPRPTEVP